MVLSQKKVLFLDIDGVLNNENTKEKFEEGIFKGFTALDKKLVNRYLEWHNKQQNLYVVLSSSWRCHDQAKIFLINNGIDFVDCTENLGSRKEEIRKYVYENEIVNYAILDDKDFGWDDYQRPWFVQTSYVHGLRKKDLNRLDKIFGG